MFLIQFLVTIALSGAPATADISADTFQADVDSATQEIMQTHMGKAICQLILGADSGLIAFHLG